MRTVEARSAQIARPEGVTRVFHVSRYKIEPFERARNLLSKHDWRAALRDKALPDGPEVALVVKACLLSGGAKWLAGATSGPDRSVVGPSGAAQGVAPDADAREEVALVERMKFVISNVTDVPLIYFTWCDVPRRNQVAQPLRSVWIMFIIVSSHWSTSSLDHRQT